ncbi:Malonyl-CoA decarboxylase, mitochondrial [Strongyloides ratti]|uniref:Malonyl-CoA decarboxylase, mitochondrial n=1 Tax=Strongyloides ratti TaxID=34506 RepID=A0A090L0Z1_STRRB|nr:Malonyl-CoA decarboxylase, mitochondrial [Strongyloides ratti]CEF61762.1 Malonyl-CoA decarboxylase, mitochondrial [Strongyloides ratti]
MKLNILPMKTNLLVLKKNIINQLSFYSLSSSNTLIQVISNEWLNLNEELSIDKKINKGKIFISAYNESKDYDKIEGLKFLVQKMSTNHELLNNAIKNYQRISNVNTIRDIYIASTPEYAKLFHAISNLSEGVRFLCELRADIHRMIKIMSKQSSGELAGLVRLDNFLKEKLISIFSLSNLSLQRITWNSPASLLQKITSKEAVHPVKGLLDIERRVSSNRRCFIFTHSAMPNEPLIVVYVALMKKIANNIKEIVNDVEDYIDKNENDKTTAIYYSISSLQPGLKGIDLGNLLIKSVVNELEKELPNIVEHSTLSPIPGFRHWLIRCIHGNSNFELFDIKSCNILKEIGFDLSNINEVKKIIYEEIESDSVERYEKLKKFFMYTCARYLCHAKELKNNFALNPVAHFHLSNGAKIYRINWKGNTSGRGIQQSLGMMVNYFYDTSKVHQTSSKYLNEKEILISDDIKGLL